MQTGIVTRAVRWRFAAFAGSLAFLAVACGSAGSTASGGTASGAPSSSAPASPAISSPNSVLCADAAALRASLDKLTHIKVGAGTVSELNADLMDIKANLTAFAGDARGQWQAQTSALESALANLQTAAKNLAAKPSTSAVAGVATALGDVNTAAQNLLAAVSTRCPSASPSHGM